MKLACLEQDIPIGSYPSKGFGYAVAKVEDAKGVEKTKKASDCM